MHLLSAYVPLYLYWEYYLFRSIGNQKTIAAFLIMITVQGY